MLRLCSILNSIYHGISYPWYFLPSKQAILVLYVCVNHLHMEIKLSSVQLLVNYMNKLYVILNWSTVSFIFGICSDRDGSYFTWMDNVKGGVSALWYFLTPKSALSFSRSGSLYHFWLQLGPSLTKEKVKQREWFRFLGNSFLGLIPLISVLKCEVGIRASLQGWKLHSLLS